MTIVNYIGLSFFVRYPYQLCMAKAYVLINYKSFYETLVTTRIKLIDDNVLTCKQFMDYIIVELIFETMSQLQNIIQKNLKISKI